MSPGTRRAGLVVIASAWLLTLIVAFLVHRGDDVGRLPALSVTFITGLARAPLIGAAGLAASALGLAMAGLIVFAWYGLGDLIARLVPGGRGAVGDPPRALTLASRALYGAAAWSAIWFVLGVAGLFRPAVAVAALVIGVGLAEIAHLRRSASRGTPDRLGAAGHAALGLAGLVLALALIAALAPPTARDALFYHFAIPKVYVGAGASIVVPDNMATFYPQGVEMQVVWAMLLGPLCGGRAAEAAAGATVFAFFPLLLLVVYGWARERRVGAAWAAIATVDDRRDPDRVRRGGQRVRRSRPRRLLGARRPRLRAMVGHPGSRLRPPIALALGGALTIKLTAAFLLIPLAILVLVRSLMAMRDTRRSGAWGGGQDSGDRSGGARPRRPLRRALARAHLDQDRQPCLPVLREPLGRNRARMGHPSLLALPDTALAVRRRDTPRLSPGASSPGGERAARSTGPLRRCARHGIPAGPAARPLGALSRVAGHGALRRPLRVGRDVHHVARLEPADPLPAARAARARGGGRRDGRHGGAHGPGRLWRWAFLAAAATGGLVILAWFAEINPVRAVLGGEPRATYLARRLDYYPYYEVINRDLPATARVWLINMRRDTYHLDRSYFSDFVFEDHSLTRYVRAAKSAEEIRTRMHASGITHLLVRHDQLFDYARSPIVDDHESREHNLAKLQLMAAFFQEGTRLIRGDGKFWLIELPRQTG